MNRIGKDIFPLLIEVKKADLAAQSDYMREEKQQKLDTMITLYNEIMELGECVDLKTLNVTGNDLIEWGMKPGKAMGEMLQKLLADVIEDPSLNDKEKLKELYHQYK